MLLLRYASTPRACTYTNCFLGLLLVRLRWRRIHSYNLPRRHIFPPEPCTGFFLFHHSLHRHRLCWPRRCPVVSEQQFLEVGVCCLCHHHPPCISPHSLSPVLHKTQSRPHGHPEASHFEKKRAMDGAGEAVRRPIRRYGLLLHQPTKTNRTHHSRRLHPIHHRPCTDPAASQPPLRLPRQLAQPIHPLQTPRRLLLPLPLPGLGDQVRPRATGPLPHPRGPHRPLLLHPLLHLLCLLQVSPPLTSPNHPH